MVRSGPLCPAVAHPGRLGWRRQQPGDNRSGEPWPRRPPHLSLPPPLPPRAAAPAALYFDSTWRGRERRGGQEGARVLLPVSLVQDRPGWRLAGTPGAPSLLARTPDRFHRRDTRTRTPEHPRCPLRKPGIPIQRLSPGASRTLAARARTQMPAPPSPTHFQSCLKRNTHLCARTHTRVSSHSCGFVDILSSHAKVTQHSGTPSPSLPG